VNLQSNDFELFGVPQRFTQDPAQLDARWKALQREVHPDNFAQQGGAQQRIAMQWSVRVNEAYQRLKNPLARATYLCELAGVPVEAHRNTAMPATFLMQQMQWREAMDEAHDLQTLESLHAQVTDMKNKLMQQCAGLIDEEADYAAAVLQIRSLLFIEKFGRDLEQRFEALET
jgi:molecular chaperone HscB